MKEAFEKIRKKLDEESVMRANSEKFYSEPQNGEYVDCVVLLKDALSIVSEVEAEYGNGWIPCKERLPNRDSDCLVTYESGKIGIMEYLETSKWGWNGEFADNRVIAWMPLPSPYKGV